MNWYEESDIQRARAEGWDECFDALEPMLDAYYAGSLPKNPYRNERDGEMRYDVPCCYGKSCTTDIERIGDAWFRISNGDRYTLPVED